MVASFSFLLSPGTHPSGSCLVCTVGGGQGPGSPGAVGIGRGLCHIILRRLRGVHVIAVARNAAGSGEGRERDKFLNGQWQHATTRPGCVARVRHCLPGHVPASWSQELSQSSGLGPGGGYLPLPDVGIHGLGEDGGRGLGDSGVGLKPFYLQEEVCAAGGHPSKAIRAGAGPVHLCTLQPPCQRCPHTLGAHSQPALCWTLGLWGLTQPREVLSVAPSIHRWAGEDSEIQQLA